MKYFKICELTMSIEAEDEGLIQNYSAFASEEPDSVDISVIVKRSRVIHKTCGEPILNDNIIWMVDKEHSCLNITVCPGNEVITSMDVNDTWRDATLQYLDNGNEWEWKRTNSLFEILFRNNLIFNEGIVLHASAIEWQGKAIVFTAPAGTGKTTQSNLWKQHMNAVVLNGDRPAIKTVDKEVFIYGTPWSGSSKDYINKRAPLAALVLLEQAPENSVRQLSSEEALMKIMPRFFLPYNDQHMMELAMNTIERILQLKPVYLLRCRPDKGAVDALYEKIR